jgi:hypothetical protein
MADDSFIDKLKLRIRARSSDVARVKHFIARLEEGYRRADGFNDAGGVPTEHAWRRFNRIRSFGSTDLRIYRVHRDRLDSDQEIAILRRGFWQFDVQQRLCIIDRQIAR